MCVYVCKPPVMGWGGSVYITVYDVSSSWCSYIHVWYICFPKECDIGSELSTSATEQVMVSLTVPLSPQTHNKKKMCALGNSNENCHVPGVESMLCH